MHLVNIERYTHRKSEVDTAKLPNLRPFLLVACSEAKLEQKWRHAEDTARLAGVGRV